jgi:hypothetical protein
MGMVRQMVTGMGMEMVTGVGMEKRRGMAMEGGEEKGSEMVKVSEMEMEMDNYENFK